MILFEIFQRGFSKRWEGMLELVFLLVTRCLLASSHHTYVQLLPTVRTHCNRNYESIVEREMRKRKLGWSAIVFANSVGETTHCLLSIPAKNGGYGLLVRCSPAEMAHRHKTGLARVLCSRERVSQKKLTLRESVASDMILSQPLKVATWKRDK